MISLMNAITSGIGIYTIPEAARYARMPAATIRSWFFPHDKRKPMRRGSIDDTERKVISFLDFVEVLAVRSLRVDYNVSLSTIRNAIDFAQRQYDVDHIFARRDHKTKLDLNKRQLHIVMEGEKDPISLSDVDAGQVSFQECVEGYMQDLDFDSDGIADHYTAFRFEGQAVVMKPAFNFGGPVMAENGYPPAILWRSVVTEGSFQRAADLYDASVESVRAAYRYCNGELGLVAA